MTQNPQAASAAAERVYDQELIKDALDLVDAALDGGDTDKAISALGKFVRAMEMPCHHGQLMFFAWTRTYAEQVSYIAYSALACGRCKDELGENGVCYLGPAPPGGAALFGCGTGTDARLKHLATIPADDWQVRVLAFGDLLSQVEALVDAKALVFEAARATALTLLDPDVRAVGTAASLGDETTPSATIYRAAIAATT